MEKNFDIWNVIKKEADERHDTSNVFFREREVWWCMLGLNVGFEQNGKGEKFQRPVLILKKFNQYVMIVVPLTSKVKTGIFHYTISSPDTTPRSAIISQIRLIDVRRLTEKMFTLNSDNFNEIKKAVKDLFT